MDETISTLEAARFVADGYLRYDAVVPEALNRAVLAELEGGALAGCRYNDERVDFDEYFSATPAYLAVMRLPQVQRLIRGLVGPEAAIDHCAVHTVGPRASHAQFWHADATIDPRTEAFDIQVFYYPHDTPREAGGTLFLPGSHFRLVHESSIARYQNIRGQLPLVCAAGTIVVAHHGIWHCSQPNRTERTRYMVKLRLNPTVRQRGLFEADEAGRDEIGRQLSAHHGWEGAEHRLEILQRLRLWRSLTGSGYDHALWLSRLENQPQREALAATAQ